MAKAKIPEGYKPVAFKFALDPTPETESRFDSHAGARRRCFNWCITYSREKYLAGEKFSPTHTNLRNAWNDHKNEVGAGADVDSETGELVVWWNENSKQVYDAAALAASRAYSNWWNPNMRAGPPRRKKKGKTKDSFQFFEQVQLVGFHHIQLPKIGVVRVHESLRKLIAADPIKIGTTTVSKDSSGRWFVSMICLVKKKAADESVDLTEREGVYILGYDLGLKTLAVVADQDGKVLFEELNSKHLDAALVRLRRANKAMARSRKNSEYWNSKRYQKKKKKAAKIHARVRNLRRDQINKFTTKTTEAYPDAIHVVENLNVRGMVRNKRMAKAVSQAGFGEIRTQISRKGKTCLIASMWFASSKTCSNCRAVKDKLHLGMRVYECEHCGFTCDRDVNAAINLARLLSFEGVGYTLTGRGHSVRQERKVPATVDETLRLFESTSSSDVGISNG